MEKARKKRMNPPTDSKKVVYLQTMKKTYYDIHSAADLMAVVQEIGFLPLLDSGIAGYSADAMVADDCRYVILPDGGWDWPLWKWKGSVVTEGHCVYGKFFDKKDYLCWAL